MASMGVKVRALVSIKCPSSGVPTIFTDAAFSALALDSGIAPEWKKREAWLLPVGRWDRKPVRSSSSREYVIRRISRISNTPLS
jgi:hypothetical protein